MEKNSMTRHIVSVDFAVHKIDIAAPHERVPIQYRASKNTGGIQHRFAGLFKSLIG
ncbi:hypothetical protein [Noviherbaspirillum saxi]|uniref:hypothetical protein n=1 Tax=Noviherbaspirillum saxi TaxID=2320863 RepID=UPI001314BDBD|nr:hypothetical protein [Noviherbaspirillum saxi]